MPDISKGKNIVPVKKVSSDLSENITFFDEWRKVDVADLPKVNEILICPNSKDRTNVKVKVAMDSFVEFYNECMGVIIKNSIFQINPVIKSVHLNELMLKHFGINNFKARQDDKTKPATLKVTELTPYDVTILLEVSVNKPIQNLYKSGKPVQV